MTRRGAEMGSKVVMSFALFTLILNGGQMKAAAQNVVAACLKPRGKIIRANTDAGPTKPCKPNHTEIRMVGTDNVHVDGDHTAIGVDALISNTTGEGNTAVGVSALQENTEGIFNTALGDAALQDNTEGLRNSAVGFQALRANTTGSGNTAMGSDALAENSGSSNTAGGSGALRNHTTGEQNTALGQAASANNTEGNNNTAAGRNALSDNTLGSNNTAMGDSALQGSTGSDNTAIGFAAGSLLQMGSNNIYLNHRGNSTESATMRLGFDQTATFIAGIRNATTGFPNAVAVLIDSAGQLGTINSARRYKDGIREMGEASNGLMKLRPVIFRYKTAYLDGSRPLEYGLVAEEVAEVYPNLVVSSKTGEVQTVQYHKLNAMLLNEVQKQHQRILELTASHNVQRTIIARLEERLEVLEAKRSRFD